MVPRGPRRRAAGRHRDDRTIVLVAADGKTAGIIAVADAVRQSGREAIGLLRRAGVRTPPC